MQVENNGGGQGASRLGRGAAGALTVATLRRLFSRASPENSDGPQGRVAGAMWRTGAEQDPC